MSKAPLKPKDLPALFKKMDPETLYTTSEISAKTGIPDSTIRSSTRFCAKNFVRFNGKIFWGNSLAVRRFRRSHKL